MASATTSSIALPIQPFLPAIPPFRFHCVRFHALLKNSAMSCSSSEVNFRHNRVLRPFEVRAVAEGEDALVQEEELPPPEADASGQTVSVPVSPSDVLTMFFQAEGTVADAAIPAVTSALEDVEGIANRKVQVQEGIASVETTSCSTQMCVEAVSSSLCVDVHLQVAPLGWLCPNWLDTPG